VGDQGVVVFPVSAVTGFCSTPSVAPTEVFVVEDEMSSCLQASCYPAAWNGLAGKGRQAATGSVCLCEVLRRVFVSHLTGSWWYQISAT